MGYILEPEGIDFFIQSKPLTKRDKKELSDFVKKLKSQRISKLLKSKKRKKLLK